MTEKIKTSKIPKIKSFLCCDLRSGNVFICRLEFLFNVLGLIFMSFGNVVLYYVVLNDVQFSDDEDGFIRKTYYEFNLISYGLFFVTILSLLAVFSYYFLDGVKMNEPQNLLPYTFKNAFFGIILTTYGICFLNLTFFFGVAFIILAICNYSLFDAMLHENEVKLIKSLTSQQTIQNIKVISASSPLDNICNVREIPQRNGFVGYD